MNRDGLQIVSDGTDDGTYVIIDGKPMRLGSTKVRWKIEPLSRSVEVCFSMSDLSNAGRMLPQEILWALEAVTNALMNHEGGNVTVEDSNRS